MRMAGTSHRHHAQAAHADLLQRVVLRRERAADPDGGRPLEDQVSDRPQRLHVEGEPHRREGVAKGRQGIDDAGWRQKAVQHDFQLAFETLRHAGDLGEQVAHPAHYQSCLGQHHAAGLGQLRFAARRTIKEGDAELRFQVADGVADDGQRSVHLTGCRGEAARLHDLDQHLQLVQSGRARARRHSRTRRKNGSPKSYENGRGLARHGEQPYRA